MAVPYTFGSATSSIPLSQLDSNFATTITLGNTAIQLGNTVTTLNNMTLANVTISSGTSNLAATAITNGTSNVTIASSGGNISMATNGATAITVDTSQNVRINTTSTNTKLSVGGALTTILGTSTRGGWEGYVYSSTNSYDGVRWNSWRARGTSASPTAVQSGDELASWQISGYSNSSSYSYAGGIFVVATGTVSGSNVPSYMSFETSSSSSAVERMRIDDSGNLGVGTTTPDFISSGDKVLSISGTNVRGTLNFQNSSTGTSGVGGSIRAYNGTTFLCGFDFQADGATNKGSIKTYTNNAGSTAAGPYVSAGGNSWTSSSDERHKDIIEPITNATEKVATLRTVIGKFKDDIEGTRRVFLFAQDVQAVLPEAVIDTNPEHLGLNYTDVIPLLVASIKEQQALITAQAETINALTARIVALENK